MELSERFQILQMTTTILANLLTNQFINRYRRPTRPSPNLKTRDTPILLTNPRRDQTGSKLLKGSGMGDIFDLCYLETTHSSQRTLLRLFK